MYLSVACYTEEQVTDTEKQWLVLLTSMLPYLATYISNALFYCSGEACASAGRGRKPSERNRQAESGRAS